MTIPGLRYTDSGSEVESYYAMSLLDKIADDLIALTWSGELSTRYSCSSLLDALSLPKRDITALIAFIQPPLSPCVLSQETTRNIEVICKLAP